MGKAKTWNLITPTGIKQMGMDNPLLYEAMFKFTQEGNCLDEHGIIEELIIECKADIGIDGLGRCFYVLKTEGWSVDSLDDIKELISRIELSLFPKK